MRTTDAGRGSARPRRGTATERTIRKNFSGIRGLSSPRASPLRLRRPPAPGGNSRTPSARPSRGPLRRLSCESSVRGEPPGARRPSGGRAPAIRLEPGNADGSRSSRSDAAPEGNGEFGDLESGEVRGTPNRRRLRRAGGVRWAGSHARSFHGGSKMRISRSSTERGEAVRWTHRRIGRPPRAAVRIAWFTLQFVDCPPRKQFLGWMRA